MSQVVIKRRKRITLKRQSGVTLVEVILAMAILGIILVPIGASLSQFFWLPGPAQDELQMQEDLRQISRWVSDDVRQAESFTTGSDPNYGTFTWVDNSGTSALTYTVRYYRQETELLRELSIDSVPQSTNSVARNIQNYSDVTFDLSAGILTGTATVTIDTLRGVTSRNATFQVKLRPQRLTAVPTPPPMTLAWDNFESDGWSGGWGWLYPWYYSGDAAIAATGTPYEGTYHLRLRRDTGFVDRALNLSGRSNVRWRFWAKVNSFEAADYAEALVSSDGTIWYTVKTWTAADSDNTYHFVDIDLSSYTMSSEFWIAFDAQMNATGDELYIDDLRIVYQ